MTGPPVDVYREPYRAADGRKDLQFGRLQHQRSIGAVVPSHKSQRSVAAAFLLDYQVTDQIPLELDSHLLDRGERQIEHGGLTLAVARAAAENDAVFNAPVERPVLARRCRHDVQVGIHDQRPPPAGSIPDHPQVRAIRVGDIRKPERIVGVLLNGVRNRYQLAFVHHRVHSRVQQAHRLSFVSAHGRNADQIAQQSDCVFPVSLDCRSQLPMFQDRTPRIRRAPSPAPDPQLPGRHDRSSRLRQGSAGSPGDFLQRTVEDVDAHLRLAFRNHERRRDPYDVSV